ncbi:SDR family NAD(P)-dependent oxidoreductase [Chrysiogenes arsenatis]|uniref:SDR family NAD(P)-dependent oxidoreductase n=1 Tax=Chrysiogenes arsenatis TaxID=309797 RepID=UPI000423318E|nr:SDR family oxidoreductase [Chrysiogenes arsenatis]
MEDNRLPSLPVALITGASRGIGRAIAEQLYADGFTIYATATSVNSIPPEISHWKWFLVDFSNSISFQNFLRELDAHEPVTALVNNAGINRIHPIAQISEADYATVSAVNLDAPYFLSQRILQRMPCGGRIVMIASIWSTISKANRTLYATTKSALTGLTRTLAAELGSRAILVNAVSPGFTRTELTQASLSIQEQEALAQQIPLGRMAMPHEIAQLVSFLVSNKNSYITGQNIVIDGGFTIV